jgi:transposase
MGFSEEERAELAARIPSGKYDGSISSRARIVLLWDEGASRREIAEALDTSVVTVAKWVDRYEEGGLAALDSRKSPGRPREVSAEERARIIALTRQSPPVHTGLSHWSSHEMASYLKRHEGINVSHNFVSVLWRENGLQPHRAGTFKLSRDPEFQEKVADIVGLYLDPPDGAVVLSVDEKTQVQALDRTQPLLPVSFGKAEKRTHDYVRHGGVNLFGALNTQTGKVTGACYPRHRSEEFLNFMNQVAAEHRGRNLHVIVDNFSTHKGDDVREWLGRNPNVTFHYTPVGSSWMNQIEIWFGILTRQAIRRGTFASVPHLTRTIKQYISTWNEDAEPFKWTATANEIIGKVRIIERDFRKMLDCNAK